MGGREDPTVGNHHTGAPVTEAVDVALKPDGNLVGTREMSRDSSRRISNFSFVTMDVNCPS